MTRRAAILAKFRRDIEAAIRAAYEELHDAALVEAGWRLCPRTGGRGHIWNIFTPHTGVYDPPRLQGLQREPCPWHRKRR